MANYAVQLYSEVPNPDGYPGEWPVRVEPLGEGTTPPPDMVPNRVLSDVELEAYRALHRPAFDAWRASRDDAAQSSRSANLNALRDIFDTLAQAETNWPTLTNVQIQGVARLHNQALLRLRPLLSDLYRDRLA